MVVKSTKKPRKISGLLPVVFVLLFGAIVFLYGKSFSERVLDLASFSGSSSEYPDGSLEARVKGNEIGVQENLNQFAVHVNDPLSIESPENQGIVTSSVDQNEPAIEQQAEVHPRIEEVGEPSEHPKEHEYEGDSSDNQEEENMEDEYGRKDEGDEHDYDGDNEADDDDDYKSEPGTGSQEESLDASEYNDYEDEKKENKEKVSETTLDDGDYEEEMGTSSESKADEDEYEEEMGTSSESKADNEGLANEDAGEKFLSVLEKCRDLICIQEAHKKYPRSSKMFNFPHFMIIGFQKAATTSLKKYLEKHSHISKPRVKEPNFFPYDCHEKPPEKCSRANTTAYITKTLHLQDYIDAKGEMAMFEASTHIVRAGHNLAPRMAKLMPWLKIIVQFREPISRAASMMIHNKDVNGVGCLMKAQMGHCLLHHSQITEMPVKKYHPITYTEAIKPWIEAFPKEQIHVIQYEALTDDEREASELLRVRKFLGVSTHEPAGGLGLANSRRFRINPEGWPLQRSQYEELVDIVKPDVQSLVELLYEHDLIDDPETWKTIWQAHWDENMKTCENDKNRCQISLSR